MKVWLVWRPGERRGVDDDVYNHVSMALHTHEGFIACMHEPSTLMPAHTSQLIVNTYITMVRESPVRGIQLLLNQTICTAGLTPQAIPLPDST